MNMSKYNFGLKLWSINENYIDSAKELYKEGIYQYIELYVVPESYNHYSDIWIKLKKEENISFIIHAPHFGHGMNLAKKEFYEDNMQMYKETKKFADKLSADIIIFHPGTMGDIIETARQLKAINDNKIVIENKPYYAINSDNICNGNSPEDIEFLIEGTNIGFCLDIGHAFCSANAQHKEPLRYFMNFLKLHPKMYHLSDGNYKGIYDKHDKFGKGSYPIYEIRNLIPYGATITIETTKSSESNLEDFRNDVRYLNEK
jgi:deoxyribonuclease IV